MQRVSMDPRDSIAFVMRFSLNGQTLSRERFVIVSDVFELMLEAGDCPNLFQIVYSDPFKE